MDFKQSGEWSASTSVPSVKIGILKMKLEVTEQRYVFIYI
jgi:hypothetical protein